MAEQFYTSRVDTPLQRDKLLNTVLDVSVRVWNQVDKQLHMGDGETLGGIVIGSGTSAEPIPQFFIPATAEAAGVTADSNPVANFQSFGKLFGDPVRGVIQLDARDYVVNSADGEGAVLFRHSNCIVRGVRGRTTISSNDMNVVLLLASIKNVVFEDITFISRSTKPTSFGTVSSIDSSIDNIRFIRCGFSYPNGGGNGVKFVANGNFRHTGVHFEDCDFFDIGRIGYEPQSTEIGVGGADQTARMWDHSLVGCRFRNVALQNISLEGYASDFAIRDCILDNTGYIGIENVGWSNGVIDNLQTRNMTKQINLFSFTNYRQMRDITISNTRTNGQLKGDVVIFNQVRLRMENNHIDMNGIVQLLGISESSFNHEYYRVGRWPGIDLGSTTVEPCSNNAWDDITLDLRGSDRTTGAAPIVFGSQNQENASSNNRLTKVRYIGHEEDPNVKPYSLFKLAQIGGRGDNSISMLDDAPLVYDFTTDADVGELNAWYSGIKGTGSLVLKSSVALTSPGTPPAPRRFPFYANVQKPIRIRNETTGGQAVSIYLPGTSSAVTIPNGESRLLYSTATEVKTF